MRHCPRWSLLLSLILPLVLLACPGESNLSVEQQDAGSQARDSQGFDAWLVEADAGAADRALSDQGSPDQGLTDAEGLDSAAWDALVLDAGQSDGAQSPDAGPTDIEGGLDLTRPDAWQYHPEGWVFPNQHGLATLEGQSDCRICHGEQLQGNNAAVSCDLCHSAMDPGWRSNCLFCHGGGDNSSGAPPVDLHDQSATSLITVGAHSVHLRADGHPAYTCEQCHLTPTDLLSAGHVFDDSPGQAELIFAQGLSQGGSYQAGVCSSNYCHGNGRTGGSSPSFNDATPLDCQACHVGPGASFYGGMSGDHSSHLRRGARCNDCHGEVIDVDNQLLNSGQRHVDGVKDVHLVSGQYSSETGDCTNTCHSEVRNWTAGGSHPEGWASEENHGFAAIAADANCQACHGDDLTGGGSGVSCDGCHNAIDNQWRTSCTFCHGDAATGQSAPPLDLHNNTQVSVPSVGAHREHLEGSDHAAVACSECHLVPSTLLAAGHIFDGSEGVEVDLGLAGISGGTYSAGVCSANYCHGDGVNLGQSSSFSDGSDLGCAACHGFPPAAPHPQRSDCQSCHAQVASSDGQGIQSAGAALHVNGVVDRTPYHPSGWANEESHGWAADQQLEDCRICHGSDLGGGGATGAIPSCDSCHSNASAAWRTDCTFCHGEKGSLSDGASAPPEALLGGTAISLRAVGAHANHVRDLSGRDHQRYDCSQCHLQPTDVLSVNHMFDDSPGQAEVVFNSLGTANTLSDVANYDANTGGCSALYCHGNRGRDNGTVANFTSTISSCDTCHPFMNSSSNSIENLISGEHKKHIKDEGAACYYCHDSVVDSSNAIKNPDLHVNGIADISFNASAVGTGTWNGNGCSLNCHGESHRVGDSW